jgi:hypothetical protein
MKRSPKIVSLAYLEKLVKISEIKEEEILSKNKSWGIVRDDQKLFTNTLQ